MADLTLTAADTGRSHVVSLGATIAVELAENPTTGYQWQIEEAGPGVTLVAEMFDLDSPPRFGSGGTKRFVFEAAEVGLSRIRLRYWQSFAGEQSIADRLEVAVEIGR